tara:strand:+ start:243 stop:992 length:750 start_codon:yes stop_codon:yes gene_type:complete
VAQVQAIIIRHDMADSRYIVNELDFPQLFFLHTRFDNKVCMATLISEQWAITAGHCTVETPLGETLSAGEPYQVSLVGQIYTVDKLVLHPGFLHPQQSKAVDMALIRLDRVVSGISPIKLYQAGDEQNQILSMIGWGYTGTGAHGMAGNDGKLRRAQNRVEKADQWLEFLFDDPRAVLNSALQLEGVPGLGDSGGPAMLETPEGMVLLGVALGEVDKPDSTEQGSYGAVSLYERISTHYQWILEVIEGP